MASEELTKYNLVFKCKLSKREEKFSISAYDIDTAFRRGRKMIGDKGLKVQTYKLHDYTISNK